MSPTLLIRADASPEIGTGHVIRCLALAQPWLQAGSRAILVFAALPHPLAQHVQSAGVELHRLAATAGSPTDAEELTRLACETNATWIVTDGYQFGAEYHRWLKNSNRRVLTVDDHGHEEPFCADFILNQNLGASPKLYARREAHTKLLLGTRFAQLRQEFIPWRPWQRIIPQQAKSILVTLGGSDPARVSLKAVQALRRLAPAQLRAVLVIGGSNPNSAELEAAIGSGDSGIRLVRDAVNMPELMAGADLALAAGGTTAWELSFMGLPALLVIAAENQRANAAQLESAGVARNLGWHAGLMPETLAGQISNLAGDFATRSIMARNGRRLVDGLGNYRVWLHLNEEAVTLRAATPDDARLLFDWANDPTVRAVSFSSAPIPWERHGPWFSARLADADCRLWIAADPSGAPLGMVRFEAAGQEAVISVSVDQRRRGKNLGVLLIWKACRLLFREQPVTAVQALVKPDNAASIRAFEKAGFEKQGEVRVENQPALQLQLRREDADL